jgi:hypothetical protein
MVHVQDLELHYRNVILPHCSSLHISPLVLLHPKSGPLLSESHVHRLRYPATPSDLTLDMGSHLWQNDLGTVFTAIGRDSDANHGHISKLLLLHIHLILVEPKFSWDNSGYFKRGGYPSRGNVFERDGQCPVLFLFITCCVGLWHQRRLRFNFRHIAENLEGLEA